MNSRITCDSIADKSAHNKSNAGEKCEKMQTSNIGRKEFKWKKTWLILCVVSIILGTMLSMFFLYFPRTLELWSTLTSPAHTASSSDGKCSTENGQALADGVKNISVPLVGREEWNAANPTDFFDFTKLKLPVPYVIIMHTGKPVDFCSTPSKCVEYVQAVQKAHIESKRYIDIVYNFLAGGDGRIYVGRGWDYMGPRSFGYDNRSISIAFAGIFHDAPPAEKQLDAARKLIELGVEIGKIAPAYKVLGHRQVTDTPSPGDALYNIIKTWSHWSPDP